LKRTYVLDANAVLTYMQDGRGAERVERLLEEALSRSIPLLISVANWAVIFYILWQERGEDIARQNIAALSRLPFQIIPLDLEQALKAGELKALHKIPYVDCLAAALASIHSATLVTADRDFEKLGRQFPILWLSR
jgi:predicted nucleic acid-binding protein